MNGVTELPLRDIHLPPAPSWWPPAPGWWVLGLGLLVLLAATWLLWRLRRRGRHRRAAVAALEGTFRRLGEHQDQQRLLRELSTLLRRIALTHYRRPEVASLTGERWLAFLDGPLAGSRLGGGFSAGAGRVLADGPYAPHCRADARALQRLCLAWVRALPRGPGR